MRPRRARAPASLVLFCAALLLAACGDSSRIADIRERGVLRVATLNGPTTYFEGAHGPQGIEYELASAFARELGVGLRIYQVADEAALLEELDQGRADVVAAAITPDVHWHRIARTTDAYQEIAQLAVGRRGGSRPANVLGFRDRRLVVREHSPQVQVLQALRDNGAPSLQWREVPRDQDPLALVAADEADFAIVDAREFAFLRHQHPGVVSALELPDPRETHWMVDHDAVDLAMRIDTFFAELKNDGRLASMMRAAMPDSPAFEFVTAQRLQQDLENLLPLLRPHFEAASAATGVDWRLLAALAYVESKWQSGAASGDGASGVMMLTADTAASLGVTDRSDPEQSILGGARYFVEVRKKIPARIPEPERSWFALAAYNVGYGHLEDARVLAQSRGGNPDRWEDVREALPLLTREEFHLQAKHGYARGWEPAQLVDQVQAFLKLLEFQDRTLTAQEVH